MSIGEGVGSPGPTPFDEPLHAYLTRRTGAWDARMRLEALAALIDRIYQHGPAVIEAATRQEVQGFDEALERLGSGLARDAARIARPEHMPQGTEPHVPAP